MHLPSERPTRLARASCRTIVGEFARESRCAEHRGRRPLWTAAGYPWHAKCVSMRTQLAREAWSRGPRCRPVGCRRLKPERILMSFVSLADPSVLIPRGVPARRKVARRAGRPGSSQRPTRAHETETRRDQRPIALEVTNAICPARDLDQGQSIQEMSAEGK